MMDINRKMVMVNQSSQPLFLISSDRLIKNITARKAKRNPTSITSIEITNSIFIIFKVYTRS